MDLDGAEKQLTKVDRFLTTLKSIIKKHWGIIICIAVSAFIYYAVTEEDHSHESHHLHDGHEDYDDQYLDDER